MDKFDFAILRELSVRGQATQQELGEAVHLSGNATGRRQRLMEERGLIASYAAKLDLEQMGFGTTVMVLIQLQGQRSQMLSEFEMAVAACPSVESCHLLSGGEDYIIILRARDLKDFERIHRMELSQLPGVSRMQSLFSLREVVSHRTPPAIFTC